MSAALRDEFRNLAPSERVERLTARLQARPRRADREPRPHDNAPLPPAERRRELVCRRCARVSRLDRVTCRWCDGPLVLGRWIRDRRLKKTPIVAPAPAPPKKPIVAPSPSPPKKPPPKWTPTTAAELSVFAKALREFHGARQDEDTNARGAPKPTPPRLWVQDRPGVVDGRVLPVRDRHEWSEQDEDDEGNFPHRRVSHAGSEYERHYFPWRDR